ATDWECAAGVPGGRQRRLANDRAALPTSRGRAQIRICAEGHRARPRTRTTTRRAVPAPTSGLGTDERDEQDCSCVAARLVISETEGLLSSLPKVARGQAPAAYARVTRWTKLDTQRGEAKQNRSGTVVE
ncbi:hypothetical protein PF008_g33513, partial [Phytophthora fragariae]